MCSVWGHSAFWAASVSRSEGSASQSRNRFPTEQLERGESSPLPHSPESARSGVGSPTTAVCTCSKPEAVCRDALELKSCSLSSSSHFIPFSFPPLSWPPPLLQSPLSSHCSSPPLRDSPFSLPSASPSLHTHCLLSSSSSLGLCLGLRPPPASLSVVLTLQQLGLALSALLGASCSHGSGFPVGPHGSSASGRVSGEKVKTLRKQ